MQFKKIIISLLFFVILISLASAQEEKPQNPFKDYLIILVHGINANGMTWLKDSAAGGDDGTVRLFNYLTKDLGCNGNVFAYSFSRMSGLHEQNMLELGCSDYDNPGAVVLDSAGNIAVRAGFKAPEWLEKDKANKGNPNEYQKLIKQSLNPETLVLTTDKNTGKGRSWIAQAKYAYKKNMYSKNNNLAKTDPSYHNEWKNESDVPDNLVPKKIIFITHSQGNFAVRGYTLADEIIKQHGSRFFKNVAGYNPDLEQQIGNWKYNNDVEKVVFITPTLLGSTITDLIKIMNKDAANMNEAAEMNYWENAKNAVGAGRDVFEVMGGVNNLLDRGVVNLYFDMANMMAEYPPFVFSAIPDEAYFAMLPPLIDMAGVSPETTNLLRKTLRSVFVQNFPNPSDDKSVESFDPHTGVGEGMTESYLKDKVIDQRRYDQPKYNILVGQGSIALNADATIKAENIASQMRVADVVSTVIPNGNNAIDSLKTILSRYGYVYPLATITDPGWYDLRTPHAKLMSLLASYYVGGVFTVRGDIVVPEYSQRGDGIRELERANRLEKLYQYRGIPASLEKAKSDLLAIDTSITALSMFGVPWQSMKPLRGFAAAMVLTGFAKDVVDELSKMGRLEKDFYASTFVHLGINGPTGLPYVEQLLYEAPSIKLDGMYRELKPNEIADYNLPTPSTQARTVVIAPAPASNSEEGRIKWPDVVVIATTNVTPLPEGAANYASANAILGGLMVTASTYYARVTSFDYTEGDSDTIQIFHPQQARLVWAGNLATKADSMILRGTLEDLTPRVGMNAEYSFNFSAWKPLPVVNDYGHFELAITLAEGQNVLAFRERNKAGYTGRQFLRMIKSSSPMLPQNMIPEVNTVTANSHPRISVAFNNIQFESNPGQINFVDNFIVDGVDVKHETSPTFSPLNVTYQYASTSNRVTGFTLSTTMGRDSDLRLTTHDSCNDGRHEVLVRVHDKYGHTLQAVWPFWVDTTPPTINLDATSLWVSNAPDRAQDLSLKLWITDNISEQIREVRVSLVDQQDRTIREYPSKNMEVLAPLASLLRIETSDYQGLPDGVYFLVITAKDQAGNKAVTRVPFHVDSQPPYLREPLIAPRIFNRTSSSLSVRIRSNEVAQGRVRLSNALGKVYDYPLSMEPVAVNGILGVTVNLSATTLEDATYNVLITAIDNAGNVATYDLVDASLGGAGWLCDRTAPVIQHSVADPYVLRPGSISTLMYEVVTQNLDGPLLTTVEVLNVKTGVCSGEGVIRDGTQGHFKWAAPGSAFGPYRFCVTVSDANGNTANASAEMVVGGIAPSILTPAADQSVSGLVAIKGRALDPDWSNAQDFSKYELWYRERKDVTIAVQDFLSAIPLNGWQYLASQAAVLAIPELNRGGVDNVSIKPVPDYGTLGYINTTFLAPGDYQLALVVYEANMPTAVDVKNISVPGIALKSSAGVQLLGPVSSNLYITPQKPFVLPVQVSGTTANVSVELVYKPTGVVVKHAVFEQVRPYDLTGQPVMEMNGVYVWQDESRQLHVRSHGSDRLEGTLMVNHRVVPFDTESSPFDHVFDFQSGEMSLVLLKVNGNYSHLISQTPYVFLGETRIPASQPMMVVNAADYIASRRTLTFDGLLPSGEVIPDGAYDLIVRAEDAGGQISQQDRTLFLSTPYEIRPGILQPQDFDPFSLQGDLARFGFKNNKPVYMRAYIKQSGQVICQLHEEPAEYIAAGMTDPTEHRLSWTGAVVDPAHLQKAAAGVYCFEVQTSPVPDFSAGVRVITSNPFSLKTIGTLGSSPVTTLDGQAVDANRPVKVAGASWYQVICTPSGTLYPPLPYQYSLGIRSGQQIVRAWPYVPFAYLAHRWFDKANFTLRAHLVGNYKYYKWAASNPDYHDFGEDIGPYLFSLERDEHPVASPEGDCESYSFTTIALSSDIVRHYAKDAHWNDLWTVRVDICDETGSHVLDSVTITPKQFFYDDTLGAWVERYFPLTTYPVLNQDIKAMPVHLNAAIKAEQEPSLYFLQLSTNTWTESVDKARYAQWMDAYRQYQQFLSQQQVFRDSQRQTVMADFSPVQAYRTDKGLFSIKGFYNNQGDDLRFSVQVALEQPMAYSRLTNRFEPWYGYVRKHQLSQGAGEDRRVIQRDFRRLFDDPAQLGFPSRNYFSGQRDAQVNRDAGQAAKRLAQSGYTLQSLQRDSNQLIPSSLPPDDQNDDYYHYLDVASQRFELIALRDPDGNAHQVLRDGVAVDIAQPIQIRRPLQDSLLFQVTTNYEYQVGDRHKVNYTLPWPIRLASVNELNQAVVVSYNRLPSNFNRAEITQVDFNPSHLLAYYDPAGVNTLSPAMFDRDIALDYLYFDPHQAGDYPLTANSVGSLFSSQPNLPVFVNHSVEYVLQNRVAPTMDIYFSDRQPGSPQDWQTRDPDALIMARPLATWPQPWDTRLDPRLSGPLKSRWLRFNYDQFDPVGINVYPLFAKDYPLDGGCVSTNRSARWHQRQLFWQGSPFSGSVQVQDNPFITALSFHPQLLDLRGQEHPALELDSIQAGGTHYDDTLAIHLNNHASELAWVPIEGEVSDEYQLLYGNAADGMRLLSDWQPPRRGVLGYLDTSRMNGEYQLRLMTRSANGQLHASTVPFAVGTSVGPAGGHVYSPYKRVHLYVPPGAFSTDHLITVTPLDPRQTGITSTQPFYFEGPLVEISPSIPSFNGQYATLEYAYTLSELKSLIDDEHKDIGLFNLYYFTPEGEVHLASNNRLLLETKDHNLWPLDRQRTSTYSRLLDQIKSRTSLDTLDQVRIKISAALSHFSMYGMLSGLVPQSVQAYPFNDLVNTRNISLWGFQDFKTYTDGNSIRFDRFYDLAVYLSDRQPFDPAHAQLLTPGRDYRLTTYPPYQSTQSPDASTFNMKDAYLRKHFEMTGLQLPYEGVNYLYTTYATGNAETRTLINRPMTLSRVMLDTVPPSLSAFSVHNTVFNPAAHKRFQAHLQYNEAVKVFVRITDAGGRLVIDESRDLESGQPLNILWGGEVSCLMATTDPQLPTDNDRETLPEGEYQMTVFAFDKAGNAGENKLIRLLFDRAPPGISALHIRYPVWASQQHPRNSLFFTLQDTVSLPLARLEVWAANQLIDQRAHVPQGPLLIPWVATSDIPDGPLGLTLNVLDEAGNTRVVTATILVDNHPPVIGSASLTFPQYSVRLQGENELSFVVMDTSYAEEVLPESVRVSVDLQDDAGQWLSSLPVFRETLPTRTGLPAYRYHCPVYLRDLPDGHYVLELMATDQAGNTATLMMPMLYDNQAPLVSGAALSSAVFSPTQADPLSWESTIWDPYCSTFNAEFNVDGLGVTWAATLPAGKVNVDLDSMRKYLVDGFTIFRTTISDQVGNQCVVTQSFGVDRTPPRITLLAASSPVFNFSQRASIKIQVNAVDLYSQDLQLRCELRATRDHSVLWHQEHIVSGSAVFVFSGEDDTGGVIPDGGYEIRVRARDQAGNEAWTSTSILVKNDPPRIVDLSQNRDSFSSLSAADYRLAFGIRSSSVSDALAVRFDLLDSNRNRLASGELRQAVSGSRYVLTGPDILSVWHPSNASGMIYINLQVKDEHGLTVNGYVHFFWDDEPPQCDDVRVQHEVFSLQNTMNEVRFTARDNFSSTLNLTAALLSAMDNRLLAVSTPSRQISSGQRVSLDLAGLKASEDGRYYYQIGISDQCGNGTSVNVAFRQDNTPPVIAGFSVSNELFSPDFDGDRDEIIINFMPSEPGTSIFTVFNHDGSILNRLVQPVTTTAMLRWNGMLQTTTPANGTYHYELVMMDEAGNFSEVIHRVLEIRKGPLLISGIQPLKEYSSIAQGVGVGFAVAEQFGINFMIRSDGISQRESGFVAFNAGEQRYLLPPSLLVGLSDGIYTLVLQGKDAAGKLSGEYRTTFKLDSTPVEFRDLKQDRTTLRPQRGDKLCLDFYLNEDVQVVAQLLNEQQQVLSVFFDQSCSARQHLVYEPKLGDAWLPPGKYTIRLQATDRAGNVSARWIAFECLAPVLPLRVTQFSAAPFSPNGDNIRDNTEITCSWSGGSDQTVASVDIELDGHSVFSLIPAGPDHTCTAVWEGTDKSGVAVKEGVYTAVLTLRDAESQQEVRQEHPILLITQLPTISVGPYYSYFSPNGDGVLDTLRVPFTLQASPLLHDISGVQSQLRCHYQIETHEGQRVWEKDETLDPGDCLFSWNGRDTSGGELPDGSYWLKLTVRDGLDSLNTCAPLAVFLDRSPPSITMNPVISPTELSLNASETVSMNIQLFQLDDSTELDRLPLNDLASYSCRDLGAQTVTQNVLFNITQRMGALSLSPGYYLLKLQGADLAGNPIESFYSFHVYRALHVSLNTQDFTPNGDGVLDHAEIFFSIEGGSGHYAVTLNLLDASERVVRTITQLSLNTPTPSVMLLDWDGQDVADGEYVIALAARDRTTGHSTTLRAPVVVAGQFPRVQFVQQQSLFSPYSVHGQYYQATVNVGLSEGILVSSRYSHLLDLDYRITDESGALVWAQSTTLDVQDSMLWDGRCSDGSVAAAGHYRLAMTVTDALGNQTVCTTAIQIDDQPPDLMIEKDFSLFFSLGSDPLLNVTLNASEPIVCSAGFAELFHDNRTPLVSIPLTNGQFSLNLSQFFSAAEGIHPGQYGLFFQAYDQADNLTERWVTFNVFAPLQASLSCDDFTPNGDGLRDTVTLEYALQGGSGLYRQHWFLVDHAGDHVKDFGVSGSASTSVALVWDGAGIAAGDYSLILNVEDAATDEKISLVRPLSIIRQLPPITVLQDNAVFSPNGDGSQDYYAVTLSVNTLPTDHPQRLSKLITLNQTILDAEGHEVAGQTWSFYPVTAANWAGRDRQGQLCPDGTYHYLLGGTDVLGNEVLSFNAWIRIDSRPPLLTVDLPRQVFMQEGGQPLQLTYQVSEPARVWIGIHGEPNGEFSDRGTLVRDVLVSGSSQVSLSSRQGEQLLSAGRYSLKFQALDAAGNSIENSVTFNVFSPLQVTLNGEDFTPNGDQVRDHAQMAYSIKGGSSQFVRHLHVKSLTGTPVTDLTSLMPRGDSENMLWDGQGMTDGAYALELSVTDSITGEHRSVTCPIVIAAQSPSVIFSEDNALFSPNGDGMKDTYVLSVNVKISPAILDSARLSGQVSGQVKILRDSGLCLRDFFLEFRDTTRIIWDGRDVLGRQCPDGTYDLVMDLHDVLGNPMPAFHRKIVLDNLAPMAPVLRAITPVNQTGADYFSSANQVELRVGGEPDFQLFCLQVNPLGVTSEQMVSVSASGVSTVSIRLDEGPNQVVFQSLDRALNRSEFSPTFNLVFDHTAPTVVGVNLSDPSPIKSGELLVSVSFSEPVQGTPDISILTSDGRFLLAAQDRYGAWAFAIPTASHDGPAELVIRGVRDRAGNALPDYRQPLCIDTQAPTLIALSFAPPAPVKSGTLILSALYSETLQRIPSISIRVGDHALAAFDSRREGVLVDYFFNIPADHSMDGRATVLVDRIVDLADNPGMPSQSVFMIDTLPPEVVTYNLRYSDTVASPRTLLPASPLDPSRVFLRAGYLWVEVTFNEDLDLSLDPAMLIPGVLDCTVQSRSRRHMLACARIEPKHDGMMLAVQWQRLTDLASNPPLERDMLAGSKQFYTVDTLPPALDMFESYASGNLDFTPDGDGQNDVITLNLRLSEPAYIKRLEIMNDTGVLVKTLARDRVYDGKAELGIVWNGTDTQGVTLNQRGYYKLLLAAEDFAGNQGETVWQRLIKVEQNQTSLQMVPDNGCVTMASQAVTPRVFSPMITPYVVFNYQLNWDKLPSPFRPVTFNPISLLSQPGKSTFPIKSVRESIEDQAGTTRYVIGEHRAYPGSATVGWDGTGRGEDGTYYFCVEGFDFYGEKSTFNIREPFIVDTCRPVIVTYSLSSDYISPESSPGRRDGTRLLFQAQDYSAWTTTLSVRMDILRPNGLTLNTLYQGAVPDGGLHSVSWNGLDAQGQSLPDGLYSAVLIVSDPAGNASRETRQICLDNTLPVVGLSESPAGRYVSLPLAAQTFYLVSTNILVKADFWDTHPATYSVMAVTGNTVLVLAEGGQAADTFVRTVDVDTRAFPAAGAWTIMASATDLAGNTAWGSPFHLIVDRGCDSVPTFTINQHAMFTTSNRLLIEASAQDLNGIAGVGWRLDNVPGQSVSYTAPLTTFSLAVEAEGSHAVSLFAIDRAGNASEWSAVQSIVFDQTAPVVDHFFMNNNETYTNDLSGIVTLMQGFSDPVSGPAAMRFSADGIHWSTWETPAFNRPAYRLDTTAGNGSKLVYVQLKDNAGNVSVPCSDTIIWDNTVPVVSSFNINRNDLYTQDPAGRVNVSVQYADALSGVAQLRFSFDSYTWTPWEPAADWRTNVPLETTSGGGNKTLYVQVQDKAGNVSVPVSDSIIWDRDCPQLTALSINNGDPYCNDSTGKVQLTLGYSDALSGVAQMRFSTDGLSWTDWEGASTSRPGFTLNATGGNGEKRVYAQVRDRAGNLSDVLADTIIWDTQSPRLLTFNINNDDPFVSDYYAQVNLTLGYADTLSGVAQMRFSTDGLSWTAWEGASTTRPGFTLNTAGGNGAKSVYVQVKDAAGNISQMASDTIIWDHTPPVLSSFLIDGDAPYTNDPSGLVTLTLSFSDATTHVARMHFRLEGGPWSAWEPALTTRPGFQLDTSNGNGTKTVWCEIVDEAGNTSTALYDRIDWDNTAPNVSGFMINNGSPYTNDAARRVNLAISYTDNFSQPDQLCLRAEGESWPVWETVMPLKNNYVLSAGDGIKTLYLKVKDRAGNVSAVVTACISLDVTPPNGSFVINNNLLYTRELTVTLSAMVSDATSGMGQLWLKQGSDPWPQTPISFLSSSPFRLTAGDGLHTVWGRFADRAGNILELSDTITLDTAAPVVTLLNAPSHYDYFLFDQHPFQLDLSLFDASNATCLTAQVLDNNSTIIKTLKNAEWCTNGNISLIWNGVDSAGDFIGDGIYTIRLTATDIVGNQLPAIDHAFSVSNALEVYATTNPLQNLTLGVDGQGKVLLEWQQATDAYTYTWMQVCENSGDGVAGGYGLPPCVSDALNSRHQAYVYYWHKGAAWSGGTLLGNYYMLNLSRKLTYRAYHGCNSPWQPDITGFSPYDLAASEVYSLPNRDIGYEYLFDSGVYHMSTDALYGGLLRIWCSLKPSYSVATINALAFSSPVRRDVPKHYPDLHQLDLDGIRHLGYTDSGGAWYRRIDLLAKTQTTPYVLSSAPALESPVVYPLSWMASGPMLGVAWLQQEGGLYKIKLRLIPPHYRPFTQGGYSMYMPASVPIRASASSANLQVPLLIAPPALDLTPVQRTLLEDPSLYDSESVNTNRPAFIWQMPPSMSCDTRYRLELMEQRGTPDSQLPFDPALADYTLALSPGDCRYEGTTVVYSLGVQDSLPENHPGSYWRWQVEAALDPLSPSSAYVMSSTSRAFQIHVVPRIESCINYPNPFKQKTTIRYKLSTDMDRVRIYIFDVAQQLVRALDGEPSGSSLLQEYNDVEWNGQNDLGEEVVNGVYIYKIIAQKQGQSSSLTGKILRLR